MADRIRPKPPLYVVGGSQDPKLRAQAPAPVVPEDIPVRIPSPRSFLPAEPGGLGRGLAVGLSALREALSQPVLHWGKALAGQVSRYARHTGIAVAARSLVDEADRVLAYHEGALDDAVSLDVIRAAREVSLGKSAEAARQVSFALQARAGEIQGAGRPRGLVDITSPQPVSDLSFSLTCGELAPFVGNIDRMSERAAFLDLDQGWQVSRLRAEVESLGRVATLMTRRLTPRSRVARDSLDAAGNAARTAAARLAGDWAHASRAQEAIDAAKAVVDAYREQAMQVATRGSLHGI